MKKYIILGSNSFLGASIVKLLQNKNYKLFLFSRSKQLPDRFCPYNKKNKNTNFFRLNFLEDINTLINFIQKIKPDYIINYSAQSMVGESWLKPGDWLQTNSYLTPLLYYKIAQKKFKLKLVHVSTPEVYGSCENKKESSLFKPTSPYALSRINSDLILPILHKEFGLDYHILRASNIYGEYQRPYRLVPGAILRAKLNKNFFLEGSGSSKRNFLHVDDLSNATYLVINKGKNKIYHISSTKILTIKTLVEKICKEVNIKFQDFVIKIKDRIGKDNLYHLNSSRIKNELNWKANISIDNGIKRVCDWSEKYKEDFLEEDFKYINKKIKKAR
jgi:dTDP-glucose 4,6-dehydratase